MTGCTIGGNQVTLWTRMLALYLVLYMVVMFVWEEAEVRGSQDVLS